MRPLLIILAALALAAPASAYHAFPGDPHWPTTTVAVNGGSCANPECRWLKIIDRTGYGATWQTTTLPNALIAVSQATGGRFQFTVVRGTRYDIGPGAHNFSEAFALTPIGAVFIGRTQSGASSRAACDTVGMPEPYCATNPTHTAKAVVATNNSAYVVRHELGHVVGLDHRTEGASVMAGSGINFDAHDKAELGRLYGHTP